MSLQQAERAKNNASLENIQQLVHHCRHLRKGASRLLKRRTRATKMYCKDGGTAPFCVRSTNEKRKADSCLKQWINRSGSASFGRLSRYRTLIYSGTFLVQVEPTSRAHVPNLMPPGFHPSRIDKFRATMEFRIEVECSSISIL